LNKSIILNIAGIPAAIYRYPLSIDHNFIPGMHFPVVASVRLAVYYFGGKLGRPGQSSKQEGIITAQAFADSLVMIREAGADNKVLALKSLEALKAIGDGQSTKLIIPGDLAGLSGVLAALKEAVVDEKKPEQAQG
jgi:hypothetical protein